MRRKVWSVASLLLVLSLLLVGCGNKITAEEIVAKVRETVESTEDAHAVVVVNVDAQGVQMVATVEVWEKSPDKFRFEVLEASQADLVGMLLVSDGQQGMAYNPARNQAMVGPVGEIETPLPQEMLTSLQEVIQEVMEASNVALDGEEPVAGQDAYRLTLSPKEGAEEFFPGGGTATLWVDKEQWIVLKATYEASTFGRGSMEVQTFDLNPGLAQGPAAVPGDDLFQFEVPEGVEILDAEAQQPEYLTLDEAKAQAEFPLLVPDYVPGGATLIEVFELDGSFVLRYDHSPEVSFAIVQGSGMSELVPFEMMAAQMTAAMQDVSLRGLNGTALVDQAGGNTMLYWAENEVTITIAGHISLDEVLKIAESLE